jgi:RNA polymerase sigma-70 factor (ECF subfamily)
MLASTACMVRDLDLAEECVQEAYVAALVAWNRDGVPNNPAAWLMTVAKRRAADSIRRERTFRSKLPLLVESEATMEDEVVIEEAVIDEWQAAVPDERLRLVFLCCHPALSPEAQIALTLRLICGMSTPDIARAFLVSEPTMAARLTRAKKKISAARIPLRVPSPGELPDRIQTVLGVIHLLFTTGHTAPSGESLMRPELVDQALHLARILQELLPNEPDVRGLLALLLVTDARRATRVGADGRPLTLSEQDRSQWDRPAIAEAHGLMMGALRGGRAGHYVLQAGIAALHAEAPTYADTDWSQIVRLYDELLLVWPSPVVALNRAVALSMVSGPRAALAEVEQLEKGGRLARYHYLFAVRADLLRRLGRTDEASDADRRALELTENGAERALLTDRLAQSAASQPHPSDG